MITKITGKNQVTVPAAIANQANIGPGTRLDWELSDEEGTLIVRVLPSSATMASELRGKGRHYKRDSSSAVANLIRERAAEDNEQS